MSLPVQFESIQIVIKFTFFQGSPSNDSRIFVMVLVAGTGWWQAHGRNGRCEKDRRFHRQDSDVVVLR